MAGRTFDEFEMGESFVAGPRRVTQADVEAFAAVSGDDNPLHLDPEYAAGTRFGRPIAHGALGLAIATGLLGGTGLTRGTLVALTSLEWTFERPLYPGSEVIGRFTVVELRRSSGGEHGRLVWGVELVDSAGVCVQRGRITALLKTAS